MSTPRAILSLHGWILIFNNLNNSPKLFFSRDSESLSIFLVRHSYRYCLPHHAPSTLFSCLIQYIDNLLLYNPSFFCSQSDTVSFLISFSFRCYWLSSAKSQLSSLQFTYLKLMLIHKYLILITLHIATPYPHSQFPSKYQLCS